MSTLKQLLHLDDGEFPAVRAQIEAQPPPKPAPFRAAYTGVAADVLPELRAADTSWSALGMRRPVAPTPIVPTDWSARLADDWTHHTAKIDAYADGHKRESARTCDAYTHAATMFVAPLLSELTELTAVQLPAWRKALAAAARDELAWIDAEMAVAL